MEVLDLWIGCRSCLHCDCDLQLDRLYHRCYTDRSWFPENMYAYLRLLPEFPGRKFESCYLCMSRVGIEFSIKFIALKQAKEKMETDEIKECQDKLDSALVEARNSLIQARDREMAETPPTPLNKSRNELITRISSLVTRVEIELSRCERPGSQSKNNPEIVPKKSRKSRRSTEVQAVRRSSRLIEKNAALKHPTTQTSDNNQARQGKRAREPSKDALEPKKRLRGEKKAAVPSVSYNTRSSGTFLGWSEGGKEPSRLGAEKTRRSKVSTSPYMNTRSHGNRAAPNSELEAMPLRVRRRRNPESGKIADGAAEPMEESLGNEGGEGENSGDKAALLAAGEEEMDYGQPSLVTNIPNIALVEPTEIVEEPNLDEEAMDILEPVTIPIGQAAQMESESILLNLASLEEANMSWGNELPEITLEAGDLAISVSAEPIPSYDEASLWKYSLWNLGLSSTVGNDSLLHTDNGAVPCDPSPHMGSEKHVVLIMPTIREDLPPESNFEGLTDDDYCSFVVKDALTQANSSATNVNSLVNVEQMILSEWTGRLDNEVDSAPAQPCRDLLQVAPSDGDDSTWPICEFTSSGEEFLSEAVQQWVADNNNNLLEDCTFSEIDWTPVIGIGAELEPDTHQGNSSQEQDHLTANTCNTGTEFYPEYAANSASVEMEVVSLPQRAITTGASNRKNNSTGSTGKIDFAKARVSTCPDTKCLFYYNPNTEVYRLKAHNLRVHEEVSLCFECEHCPNTFSNHQSFVSHLKIHAHLLPWKCQFKGCLKEFGNLRQLSLHDIMRHNQHLCPYECEYCGKKEVKSYNFHQHLLNHTGERPVQCEACGSSFKSKSNLNYHKLRCGVDSSLAVHSCPECQKTYSSKSSLTGHRAKEHGIALGKVHTCSQCDYISSNGLAGLNRHVEMVHSEDRTKQCSDCPLRFKTKSTLQAHQLAKHCLNRHHWCLLCDSSFTMRSKLKQHMLRHTGVKSFPCDVCEKHFFDMSAVNRHRRITHKVLSKPKAAAVSGNKW